MTKWVPIDDLMGIRSSIEVPVTMDREKFDELKATLHPFVFAQVLKRYNNIGSIKVLQERWQK